MNARPAYIQDTIVAAATPTGKGGIGVVRISGVDTENIATQMLGRLPSPRHATAVTFVDQNAQSIDSGLALYFPAPASFTGESVLELQGHGGPVVVAMLVDAAVSLGARRAQPGEFSQRAFLNGKLDLVQAESIVDLINSGTAQAARAAHRSLTGIFSQHIDALAETLIRLRIHVEAALDFPEEEIDFLSDEGLQSQLENCAHEFDQLASRVGDGRILRDGLRFVIVGKPNAGKSSLMNCLSGQDVAIVTEIEGTTRDLIREQIEIDGLAVELIDTAGLRDDPGTIEAEGIRRAKDALASADAVLWVQDVTAVDADQIDSQVTDGAAVIVVHNKVDLLRPDLPDVDTDLAEKPWPVVSLSAKTGAGVDDLKKHMRNIAGFEDLGEGAFTARQRHVDALADAAEHFFAGKKALTEAKAGELLAEELRLAHAALTAITGDFSSDDLLGRIFSEFCIGK